MLHLDWRETTFLGGPPISTSVTEDETRELQSLAPGKRVLEIGSAFGYSAIAMALAGAVHVDSVDHHLALTGSEGVMRENLNVYGVGHLIDMHVFGSGEILSRLTPGYDLIFIDGDHSDGGVSHDIDVALKFLKDDGVLVLHDYMEDCCQGIRDAVHRRFDGAGTYKVVDTTYIRALVPVPQLVSIVTCTWGRPKTIVGCIETVRGQRYPNIEHLIIIDGQDPEVVRVLEEHGYTSGVGQYRYVQLGRNWTGPFGNNSNGAIGRKVGSYLAAGDFICYLDDDNVLDPGHVEVMLQKIRETGVDIVISDVGGSPCFEGAAQVGRVDTSSFMHRPEILKYCSWETDGYCCDGNLVSRWVSDHQCSWVRKEGATVTLMGQRNGSAD